MQEDFTRLVGNWDIEGTMFMTGQKIPVRGVQKGYIDKDKKFVLESDFTIDFGTQKTPWKTKIIQDQSKVEKTHEGTYKIFDSRFGESEGKTIFLPNCAEMVDKNPQYQYENHMISYWLNDRESHIVTYQLDEKGHLSGNSEFTRKPRK